ncbi:hypothetical protein F503_07857 [Ophiostoma piceae UAMH 11346]|uniref:Uncharacterized protein n=1 Tax=Ophiostoma piceae (strain UAMH 11346) TaxID=1262450 RepID=S3C5V0_OPHP1|nr:hypothetical protein F503_07857 [Ophiostoma piceae UAMH 11346]
MNGHVDTNHSYTKRPDNNFDGHDVYHSRCDLASNDDRLQNRVVSSAIDNSNSPKPTCSTSAAIPSPTSQPSRSNDSSLGLSTSQITGIVFGVVGATLVLVLAVVLLRRWVQRRGAAKEIVAAASLNLYVTPPGTPPLFQPPGTTYASPWSALPATAAVMPASAWSTTSDEGAHQQDTRVGSISPDMRQQYLRYQRYIDEGTGVESDADEVAAAVARELELPLQSGLSTRRVSQVPSSTALGELMSGSEAEDGQDN